MRPRLLTFQARLHYDHQKVQNSGGLKLVGFLSSGLLSGIHLVRLVLILLSLH